MEKRVDLNSLEEISKIIFKMPKGNLFTVVKNFTYIEEYKKEEDEKLKEEINKDGIITEQINKTGYTDSLILYILSEMVSIKEFKDIHEFEKVQIYIEDGYVPEIIIRIDLPKESGWKYHWILKCYKMNFHTKDLL